MTTTSNAADIVTGYKYGWHDPEFKPVNEVKKGLDRDVVAQISELKNEPQWMRDFRLRVARALRVEADADRLLGRQHPGLPARLQRHLLLRASRWRARARPGRTCRTRSSTPSTSWASRRRSASSSPASAPSTTPRSSTTRSARTSRSSACSSSTWTAVCASTRTSSSSTSARSCRRRTTSSRR